MKLSEQDADLFFKLMWSLQSYVNTKLQINPQVNSVEEYTELTQEEKFAVREKIFEQSGLITNYVETNPDGLSIEELAIVSSWTNFIKGDFYIERYLKKNAIFIHNNDVYAVLALYEGFDEMIHKSYLPLYTRTVLLPFKGQIIYDGLMQSYNVHFGGGIRGELKETYMFAKQNNKIITTLGTKNKAKGLSVINKDWSKEIAQLSAVSKKLKGGSNQPVINSPVFSLVKSTIELANRAIVESCTPDEIEKELKKVERALNKLSTIVYRME